MAQTSVRMFYQSVIDDVIMNVREAFIDDGLDEQTLTELKQLWERKVGESKVTELPVTRSSQPVQLQSARVTSSFSDQLRTVAPHNVLAQTALHYTTQTGDVSKAGAAHNVPVKLNFTVPARVAHAGLQSLLTTASGGNTAVHIPHQQITQLLQSNVLQAVAQSNPVQHGAHQVSGVHYQVVTPQLPTSRQFTVAVPVAQPQKQPPSMMPLDGANDEDDEEDNDTSDEDEELSYSDPDEDSAVEDDPLNSNDDESDEDPADVFDADNVIVCQYDKIVRSKNKWKFHLKDGIMNINGKDYIFGRTYGDTEW